MQVKILDKINQRRNHRSVFWFWKIHANVHQMIIVDQILNQPEKLDFPLYHYKYFHMITNAVAVSSSNTI